MVSFAFTQEIEILQKEEASFVPVVQIEIDLNQFIEKTKNSYWEKDGRGFIHVGVRTVKYEDMKTFDQYYKIPKTTS